jgi:hypothetical protein
MLAGCTGSIAHLHPFDGMRPVHCDRSDAAEVLEVRYLGAGGVLMRWNGHAIMTAPSVEGGVADGHESLRASTDRCASKGSTLAHTASGGHAENLPAAIPARIEQSRNHEIDRYEE